ncbi:MAG: ATP-dependent DNA helicase RecG [Pseudomonadota bacterium]
MRPPELNTLFAPVTSIKGVGPKSAPAYDRLLLSPGDAGPARVMDLVFHMPNRVVDRRKHVTVQDALVGEIVTLTLRVIRHFAPPPGRRNSPHRVICEDDTDEIAIVFFGGHGDYIHKLLPAGETVVVSGLLESFNDRRQIVHPDHVVPVDKAHTLPQIEPIYPLTAGVSRAMFGKAINGAVETLPDLGEWIEPSTLAEFQWPTWHDAATTIHRPIEPSDADPHGGPWQRLAYDELLAGQLALGLLRKTMRDKGGTSRVATGNVREHMTSALPFSLTGAQGRALDEIQQDMEAPDRMLRLLQGDVGSGKTVVAALAMAHSLDSGWKAALMAPTEILARQHLATFTGFFDGTGVRLQLLTGRDTAKERRETLEALKSGEIDILIGTHALFQETVEFNRLGLVVIDEQHRFGVHQRLALGTKNGADADMLVMTATPIPRTLVLTHYGDMDVSILDEKPPGRQPIDTRVLPAEKLGAVTERLKAHVESGGQAYWVCPLVEDSELDGVVDATARHKVLSEHFGDRVAIIHGRMPGTEKDAVMAAFQAGEVSILVATTVIEVGVDVPNATIIVIENAERFGLAQLHQLRGRVGRGSDSSVCLLVYGKVFSQTAQERLRIMRETEDGFRIAEKDLELRGGGDILGTRQSGETVTEIADPSVHRRLLEPARQSARLLLETDPMLLSSRGRAARVLLHLFGKVEAVRLIEAG